MMNRLFLREEDQNNSFSYYEKEKIGVIGMGNGAGATFIATALAKHLSLDKDKQVAFVDVNFGNNQRMTFDALGMDKRFVEREFHDFFQLADTGAKIKGVYNIDEKINWALQVPLYLRKTNCLEGKLNEYGEVSLLRVINSISGNMIICDFDVQYQDKNSNSMVEILKDMDVIVLVVDPLPSRMIGGYKVMGIIKMLKMKGKNIITVINKNNTGVIKKELYAFTKLKNPIIIPYVNQELIYAAEYNCKIPYSKKNIIDVIGKEIEKISQNLH